MQYVPASVSVNVSDVPDLSIFIIDEDTKEEIGKLSALYQDTLKSIERYSEYLDFIGNRPIPETIQRYFLLSTEKARVKLEIKEYRDYQIYLSNENNSFKWAEYAYGDRLEHGSILYPNGDKITKLIKRVIDTDIPFDDTSRPSYSEIPRISRLEE